MVTGICVLMFITDSTNNESTYFVQNLHRQVSRSSSTNQSVVRVSRQCKPPKSNSRSQAVDVSSFSLSVDPVDSIQSKLDLIHRHIYYDPRAFLSQIGSQNLSKVQAIFILNDVTIVCD